MRLHRLQATAFGPFATKVEVDLDAVSAGGLFLIRGATGAGKTSLLDAVAFALYADVPGARSKKQLHSDHADRGVVPSVTLEFTAGGRRLKIERSPEFRRPKSRGKGETTVQAKAVLWERRGTDWVALSTRHDEIADVVKDVLGMGLEQFSKVVLLPQGDFAAFLRATPEERRSLLERLFDVSSFAGIEDWFAVQRKDSAAAVAEHRAALNADLAVLADVLADAPAIEAGAQHWSELPVDQLPAALEAARQALDEASTARLAAVDATRLADETAATAHAVASETVARRSRGLAARATLAALAAEAELRDAHTARIQLAERAATVAGDLKALDRVTSALESARRGVEATRPDVARWALEGRGAEAVQQVVERLEAGTLVLSTAQRAQLALHERARALTGLERDLTTTTERVEQSTRAEAAARAELVEATSTLAAAEQGAARLEGATARLERARALLLARLSLDEALARHRTCQAQLAEHRSTAQDLRDVYQDRRQARLDAMAGELASRLERGQPCPVCGASEHPHLASSTDLVTADQVSEAEDQWQRAAAQVAQTERTEAAIAATVVQLREQLADESGDQAHLEAAVALARQELDDASALAQSVEGARTRVATLAESVDAIATTLSDDRQRCSTLTSRIADATAELEAVRAALTEALDEHAAHCPCAEAGDRHSSDTSALLDPEALTATGTHHARAVTAATTHAAAVEELHRAERDADGVASATDESFRAAGFSSADEARAGRLPEVEVVRLREAVAAYDEAALVARTTLADPEVGKALESAEVDIAALAVAREAAHSAHTAAVAADTLVRRTIAGLDRVRGSISDLCGRIVKAEAHHQVIRELADTVAGTSASNELRMRLSAFVLAARLEKVATLANERLAHMGEGRYQLRHTDGLAARGARSGLGLEVLDLWTGQARATTSLSGGESFMASLALALGLADAVREEAGGFDLQTLFVDEGFGTLDDESLEQVMAVLDDLREGGRAVGVVSHVAELRTRITSQVVVRKTERGSSVQVTSTDEAAPAA
ncbi:exonuclease SbcC [Phycicoccus badiiscoriae]|uniref:Nuclease SbcCD subunit C n=1 Tax=Pedococcus badiiscoriae TaxID=642776 RepID=A0A852WTG8_9MICO|nr:SMC family ATPase [Pedococcus badiiscoriae]NYG08546.1 exonuclease SbcC [Pedococcus badiiscoriae]